MKKLSIALLAVFLIAACGKKEGTAYNLDPDEMRRAQTHAAAYFDAEHPAGTDASGNLVKKKGTLQACRPQDSNANGMVTCTGVLPTLGGGFETVTRYCGYKVGGVISCSDKDQQ